MRTAVRLFMTYAFIATCIGSFSAYAQSQNLNNLQAAFQARDLDKIIRVLNDIKGARYQGDVLPVVKALWKGDSKALEGIPPELVGYPIVRINLADILLQAYKNGMVNVDVREIHQYARETVKSDDYEVKVNAMFVLGSINDERDVGTLKDVALQTTSDYLFRSAVVSLAKMCNSKANEALAAVEQNRKESEKARYVKETRAQFENMKKKGGFCG